MEAAWTIRENLVFGGVLFSGLLLLFWLTEPQVGRRKIQQAMRKAWIRRSDMGPIEWLPQWPQTGIGIGLFELLRWVYALSPLKWQRQAQAEQVQPKARPLDTTQPPNWWHELEWSELKHNELGRR